MKKAIVNLSTGAYVRGAIRLGQSIHTHNPEVEYKTWVNETLIGAPYHKANPYAFKPFAIQRAFDEGADSVFWSDASAALVRDMTPIFDLIEKDGYFMQEAGHNAGVWTNDNALRALNISRDEAMGIPLFTAGVFGLSKHSPLAMEFLKQWRKHAEAGLFIGRWDNNLQTESKDPRCKGHRHDFAIGGIIAHKLGMKYQNGGEWINYASPSQAPKENVYIHLQGIV